jgi:transposase
VPRPISAPSASISAPASGSASSASTSSLLAAQRQRVTERFRARLAERVAAGAAHAEVAREERTTRYQVACAFADWSRQREARDVDRAPRRLSLDEAHHRRGGELATVVCDLNRRCVIEVLDGRDRRTIERWLSALPVEVRADI